MMKDALKTIVTGLGMTFDYAREDFANLADTMVAGVSHCILYPVKETKVLTEHGQVEKSTFSGSFLVARRSDIDEPYSADNNQGPVAQQGKYEKYIEPIKAEIATIPDALSACVNQFTIRQWSEAEVVNQLSPNLDGVYVTFELFTEWP